MAVPSGPEHLVRAHGLDFRADADLRDLHSFHTVARDFVRDESVLVGEGMRDEVVISILKK